MALPVLSDTGLKQRSLNTGSFTTNDEQKELLRYGSFGEQVF
jgi:hypothetical protein